LDGFGVGATYGLRRIRVSLRAIGLISGFSGLTMLIAMGVGQWLSTLFSPQLTERLGAIILLGIGVWVIYQNASSSDRDGGIECETFTVSKASSMQGHTDVRADIPVRSLLKIEIKWLRLMVQILRTPSAADVDRSGWISPTEAVLLGLALSLDAFGAGIGAAMIGYPPIGTATFITIMSGMFVLLGIQVGLRFANLKGLERLSLLPGLILILMGLLKMV
jgi:putative Mn2+ efflux pump MntP